MLSIVRSLAEALASTVRSLAEALASTVRSLAEALASTRKGLPLLGLISLAHGSLIACDKPYPKESVKPFSFETPGSGSQLDASAFVPSDAGAGEGGSVTMCSAPSESTGPFSKAGLLESIAACTSFQHCELEALAQDFVDKTAQHAATPTPAALEAARNSWFFLMRQVQVAELFQFGPAAPLMEPGGLGLRSEIYAFPGTNRCKIDEQLVDRSYEDSAFANSDSAARGMAAAEYLLFDTGTSNGCTALRAINRDGTWAALSPEELAERKASYASAVAKDVLARVQALRLAWDPAGGNFTKQLVEPGAGSVYADQQAALNAVGSALFYLDKEVKDWKITRPAGLSAECLSECSVLRESLYANVGASNIEANVAGFRLLFEGCAAGGAGLGFDDWLRALGQEQLASDTIAALEGATAAAKALEPSLEQILASDPDKARATLAAFKAVTDLLKTDMTTALDLELPMSVASDND